MPSSKKARQAVRQLLEGLENEGGRAPIVDLGSGWGHFIIPLAMKYPDRQFIGYELSFIPWCVSLLIAKCLGLKNLSVYRQDFLKADLSVASIAICYLFPGGMAALAAKLAGEKNAIRYVISHNFALPGYQAEQTIQLDDFYRSPVYRYRID
jgi:hypothetical protein